MGNKEKRNMEYKEYINKKLKINNCQKLENIDRNKLNKNLFDFQIYGVEKALKKGKFALFFECGLGKTLCQLSWADYLVKEFNKPILIICPLAVAGQTIEEAKKFNIETKIEKLNFNKELENIIYITNYEQLDNVNESLFNGVVLDESSIIKNFTGAFRNTLFEKFKDIDFKLCCTATPSPNDPTELGNHSEFLNVTSYNNVLSKYFVHDAGETQTYRLKGHARGEFWKFISTWSLMVSNPNDLGFNQANYKLPDLNIEPVFLTTEKQDNGQLFNDMAVDSISFNRELRRTLEQRMQVVADIVNNSNEFFIIWIKLNDEGDLLRKLIPDAVEVNGSLEDTLKEQRLLGFANKDFRVLITKTQMAKFGLNYQHCNNQIFASLDFSFEGTYQAIRRSYRFGQTKQVNVKLLYTDTMSNVIDIYRKKEKEFKTMQEEMQKEFNNNNDFKEFEFEKQPDYKEDNFTLLHGDCVERIKEIPDKSIDMSIFSPPFADLYCYSDNPQDMGNCENYDDFSIHFEYLVKEISRVFKDGRICAIHCCDLPVKKGVDGYIGLRDFSGLIIEMFQKYGFIYHSRVTIWKDPVVEMQRTKALGLLHKQVKKDSSMSRVGIPDYLLIFRKSGINQEPITNTDISVDEWQQIASPVWLDINYSNTLNGRSAREDKDEKHICPLQLDTIARAIKLWSNPNDLVLTPFLGIGSEVYQALKMKRKGIGIELKKEYFLQAVKNCKEVVSQLSLF